MCKGWTARVVLLNALLCSAAASSNKKQGAYTAPCLLSVVEGILLYLDLDLLRFRLFDLRDVELQHTVLEFSLYLIGIDVVG